MSLSKRMDADEEAPLYNSVEYDHIYIYIGQIQWFLRVKILF